MATQIATETKPFKYERFFFRWRLRSFSGLLPTSNINNISFVKLLFTRKQCSTRLISDFPHTIRIRKRPIQSQSDPILSVYRTMRIQRMGPGSSVDRVHDGEKWETLRVRRTLMRLREKEVMYQKFTLKKNGKSGDAKHNKIFYFRGSLHFSSSKYLKFWYPSDSLTMA